ncbi:Bcr/CflA family efflux MFS transporter [Endozoicomonas euniceicola]|uniref:Bcr/CflA family efflux transporter n=1 Tax=Endozoicomonas euniceicola TaxID=1234143 RepID=A0ABY6GSI6_9GAMM|nr:Bcr/CflA family efflux MFS transporter [Endozoicomonas euniceicola]UYM15711.1 Bcr/CflA family efflux MFS transporter [Endozoicomonas euniceicola]
MRQLNPEKHTTAVLVVLTLFAVVGPVSIDIFTPSLPAITQYFDTDHTTAQWSVGIFMLGFSLSMLIVGPLSDRFGRKNTLLGGYSLYLLATIATLTTSSIHLFIAARFAQALFGCFGTAVARTIARDYYSDKMEVKILAYISACLTLAPMAAPIAGGYIQQYAGWQYSFLVMAAFAIIAMLAMTLLPEKSERNANATTGMFKGYSAVLTDLRYMRFSVAAGVAFAGAFVFVAGAPFVLIEQLGINPKDYGFIFAAAIAAYLVSASMGPKLTDRLSREKVTLLSGSTLATGALISLVSAWFSGGESVVGYVVGIVVYELGLGIFNPLCQARATEHMKNNIGTASGLIFFIEMLMATLISGAVGLLPVAGTMTLAVATLASAAFATLCLMGTGKPAEQLTARTA